MKKFTAYLIVFFLGASLGYFINSTASGLNPNWRWVIVKNNTQCKIQTISIIKKDRTISANNDQLEKTKYPQTKSTNEEYIPILVSENDKYNIEVNFDNCKKITSKIATIESGMYIYANISEHEIKIANR